MDFSLALKGIDGCFSLIEKARKAENERTNLERELLQISLMKNQGELTKQQFEKEKEKRNIQIIAMKEKRKKVLSELTAKIILVDGEMERARKEMEKRAEKEGIGTIEGMEK